MKKLFCFLTAAVAAIVPAFFNDAFVVLLFLGPIVCIRGEKSIDLCLEYVYLK